MSDDDDKTLADIIRDEVDETILELCGPGLGDVEVVQEVVRGLVEVGAKFHWQLVANGVNEDCVLAEAFEQALGRAAFMTRERQPLVAVPGPGPKVVH